MELAAKAVGKLALVSGTYSTEYIDVEVKRAFEWLSGDRQEGKRLAAVRIEIENVGLLEIHHCINTWLAGLGAS
jgi:hypothetical protein